MSARFLSFTALCASATAPFAVGANFIEAGDKDGDGRISYEEFIQMPRPAQLPEEKRKRAFRRLDKNDDGFVDRHELKKRHGSPIRRMVEKADTDGDKSVTLEEFVAAHQKLAADVAKARFARLDRNGDGQINRKDEPRHGPRGGDRIMRELDSNRDGELTYEEWKLAPHLLEIPEERAKKMFERLDRNNDGVISREDHGGKRRREKRGGEDRPPRGEDNERRPPSR